MNSLNLAYSPATGLNYPFTDVSRRPIPGWATGRGSRVNTGRSNYRGLETAFNKRMSNHYRSRSPTRWPDCGTTIRSHMPSTAQKGNRAIVVHDGTAAVQRSPPISAAKCGLATSDQRHRAVFNGIFELPKGFLVSGLYFYGSGARFAPTSGGDRRGIGSATGSRLRADGSLVPRNSFVGNPIHRVDLRGVEDVPAGWPDEDRGFADSFNLFNHENYNAYTLVETSPLYGKGSDGTLARRLQLGFRVTLLVESPKIADLKIQSPTSLRRLGLGLGLGIATAVASRQP